MSTSLAEDLLRLHLESASRQLDVLAILHLRAALQVYVAELQGRGEPIERIIVAVKRVAADAGLRPSSDLPLTDAALDPNDRLLVDIVRWAVEHYYELATHRLTHRP
jgi:hypothetical protein